MFCGGQAVCCSIARHTPNRTGERWPVMFCGVQALCFSIGRAVWCSVAQRLLILKFVMAWFCGVYVTPSCIKHIGESCGVLTCQAG